MLDNNSHYPKKMVIFLFLTLGTLYQLILFPILVSLIMWNKDIGLAYAVAIPFYLIEGVFLIGMPTLLCGIWLASKQTYKSKRWWVRVFVVGFSINATFFIGQDARTWLAISLVGGISALIVSMSALPKPKQSLQY